MFLRWFNFLALVVSIGLLSLSLVNLIPSSPLRAVVVRSGSMEPTIKVGDVVLILRKNNYLPREVVLYRRGGKFILHRLVSQENGLWQTRGDANPTADLSLVAPSQIIGQSILIIPYLGRLIFLRHYLILLPFIFLLFGLLSYYLLRYVE